MSDKDQSEPTPESVDMDELDKDVEDTQGADRIMVTCGRVQGTLCMEFFLCPGIHQKCIEYEGEMLTPKAFCVMGEKQRLKDWKNAIRYNGKSIRKCMDSGILDFFDHNNQCTGRCISRHYGTSKYDHKIANLQQANEASEWPSFIANNLDGPGFSLLRSIHDDSQDEKKAISDVVFPGMDSDCGVSENGIFIKQEFISDDDEDLQSIEPTEAREISPAQFELLTQRDIAREKVTVTDHLDVSSVHDWNSSDSSVGPINLVKGNTSTKNKRKNSKPKQVASKTNGVMKVKVSPKARNGPTRSTNVPESDDRIVQLVADLPDTETLLEDSVSFWQGIKEMGLLEDIVRDAKICLENLKNDLYCQGFDEVDARKLSDVVSSLGLVTKIKWRMAEHKMKTENEKQRLLQEIEELKKKVYDSEARQQAVKRKSDCFDSLFKRARAKTTPSSTSSAKPEADSSTAHFSKTDKDSHRAVANGSCSIDD